MLDKKVKVEAVEKRAIQDMKHEYSLNPVFGVGSLCKTGTQNAHSICSLERKDY